MNFSIIIPTYNRAAHLEAAIDSALSQMVAGDELIVVDDGSEDTTPAVLDRYNGRITAIQAGHGGAGRARNLGIARARNELIAFLDSDDRWLPQKLRIQRAFMQRRADVLFCFTNFEVEFRDGSVQPGYLQRWSRDRATWEDAFGQARSFLTSSGPLPGISDFHVYEGDLYTLQLTGFYVLTDTLVARRVEAGSALRFAEDLSTYEDLECFYRLSRRGKGALFDIDTVRQVDHPHGRLSQRGQLEKIDARLVLVRRIWGSDSDFLRRHEGLYRKTLNNLLAQKAGLLLSQGENQAAREALSEASSAPLVLRSLVKMPRWLTMPGLRMRQAARKAWAATH